MIRAECHSDDFVVTAKFDAAPWFAQATEDEIVMLARQEWGGDYAADAIVHHLESEAGYESIGAIFTYLSHRPTTPSGDTIGFEVNVHAPDALRWLLANRTGVFDEVVVVMGIDEKQQARLKARPAEAPQWDSDTSWTNPSYDRPRIALLEAPESVIEFLVAKCDSSDVTLDQALRSLQQMDQDALDDLNDYFRDNRPAIRALRDGLVAAIAKYGTYASVRDRLPAERLAGPALAPTR